MRGMWTSVRTAQRERRREGDVPDPQRDRRLRDAQRLRDVGERATPRPQGARLLLLLDLAPVAHGCRLPSPSQSTGEVRPWWMLPNARSSHNEMCTSGCARGTKLAMRFRVGLLAGFAVGYYLGSKAGRERYEQIRRWIEDARRSRPAEKAQAAVELGLERVRQKSEAVTGSTNGPGASS